MGLFKKIKKESEKVLEKLKDDVSDYFNSENTKSILKKVTELSQESKENLVDFLKSDEVKALRKQIKELSKKGETGYKEFTSREDVKTLIKTLNEEALRIKSQINDKIEIIREKLNSESTESEVTEAKTALNDAQLEIDSQFSEPEFILENGSFIIEKLNSLEKLTASFYSKTNMAHEKTIVNEDEVMNLPTKAELDQGEVSRLSNEAELDHNEVIGLSGEVELDQNPDL